LCRNFYLLRINVLKGGSWYGTEMECPCAAGSAPRNKVYRKFMVSGLYVGTIETTVFIYKASAVLYTVKPQYRTTLTWRPRNPVKRNSLLYIIYIYRNP
jgi:hypothetical protein